MPQGRRPNHHLLYEAEKFYQDEIAPNGRAVTYDNKTGQEDLFLQVMAPYIVNGSEIRWVGEEGAHWRWRFVHGSLIEEHGMVFYGGCSRAVAGAVDMDAALDEIIRIARPVFIFDNIILYRQLDTKALEPSYVRAIGRGRSYEAQLTWGEATANEAIASAQVLIRKEEADNGDLDDRIRVRFNELIRPANWQ